MTKRDELLKKKLEEVGLLLEEVSSLVSEEKGSDEYDPDLDWYGNFETRLDTLWSDVNEMSGTVSQKATWPTTPNDGYTMPTRWQCLRKGLQKKCLKEARQTVEGWWKAKQDRVALSEHFDERIKNLELCLRGGGRWRMATEEHIAEIKARLLNLETLSDRVDEIEQGLATLSIKQYEEISSLEEWVKDEAQTLDRKLETLRG